jgi:lipoprotein-anchoring transpeptidase ErfK/SrfK
MPAPTDPVPRSRRRQRRTFRRRRVVVGGAVATLVLVIAGGALALSGGGSNQTASTTTTTTRPVTTTTAAPSANNGPSTVATAAVPKLKVFEQPNIFGPVVTVLKATTDYGLATTLLIDPAQTQKVDGFLPVLAPLHKPNDTPGWVLAKQVTLSSTSYSIDITLSTHTLVLKNAGQEVLSTKVIIGAPQSPTPTGHFYLIDPVNCNKMSVPGYPLAKCRQVYGAFAIGTSGLSDVLDSFSGTVPQIAIHGMNLPPSELGKDLSNGCVRIPNDVILQIAKITPLLGTPVTISA